MSMIMLFVNGLDSLSVILLAGCGGFGAMGIDLCLSFFIVWLGWIPLLLVNPAGELSSSVCFGEEFKSTSLLIKLMPLSNYISGFSKLEDKI